MSRAEPQSAKRRQINIPILIILAIGLCSSATIIHQTNTARERARRADCAGNFRQIGMSLHMYSGDHREKFPDNLHVLQPYLKQPMLFQCPSTDWRSTPRVTFSNAHLHGSYFYVAGLNEYSADSDMVHMFDDPRSHGKEGGNILYVGGYVQWAPEDHFWHILEVSGISKDMVLSATSKIIRVEDLLPRPERESL